MNKPRATKTPPPWERFDYRTPNGKFALDVLHSTIGSQWESLPTSLQLQIEQALPPFEVETVHNKTKQANRLEYTRWIDRISRTMMAGERVENLLTGFLEELDALVANNKSDALFALLLEQVEDDKGRKTMHLLEKASQRVHPQHWQGFRKQLHVMGSNPFFQACLDQQHDMEVILARFAPHYVDELGSLITATIRKDKIKPTGANSPKDRFWLSSIALPSDYAPNRCILIAYENTGDEIRPHPPQGAAEEWRVLYFLRIAYNQINYRIRDLPKYVQAQRRTWIRELAPSVLAHEAAAQTQIISDSSIQATDALVALLDSRPELQTELASAANLMNNVLANAANLNRTFKTYLNLQRRSRVESFPLEDVFEEAWELCKQRLVGIEVAVEEDAATLVIKTDRVLLTLVLTNLLTNAGRAINEGKWPDDHIATSKNILLLAEERSTSELRLILANSGPKIPQEQFGRIFEQGFSTYPDGHGQGLFVCRLICQHLGGDLLLTDPQAYGQEFNAAFVITLNPSLANFGGDKS